MIESVSITPVYKEWENHVSKKLTGFGIFIECGIKDAGEIFSLVEKMTKCPHSTESEEEVKELERKGTWLKDDIQNHVELTYHCSECGFEVLGKYELTKYCGGCGARMNCEET